MTALTVETAVHSATLSSRCIPAYPEYTSSTTFNAAFYAARQAETAKHVAADDTYTIVVPS
jgi:hypothetical protein